MDNETEVLDRLITLARERKVDDADLDDVVHDIYSQRASNLNNEGLGSQLAFLLAEMGEARTADLLREMNAE